MTIYQTTGTLTGIIEDKNLREAQDFLTKDDMTPYMDKSIAHLVSRVRWELKNDGHGYLVEAVTTRDLKDDELRVLSEWVSGQNSDGLGETFEQQDFALANDYDGDCGSCEGCEEGDTCDFEYEGNMISFDWKKNKSVFKKIA